MKNQKGFSLIELLIVVVIIGIIAAIAIPNLIAARRSANEGSAQSTIRTLHSAQVTYQSTNGGGQFGTIAQLATAKLVDSQFLVASTTIGNKSGYNFDSVKFDYVKNVNPASFAIGAYPSVSSATVTQTGTRVFCMGTDGVLWQWKPEATGAAQLGSKIGSGLTDASCSSGIGFPLPEVVQ